MVLARPSVLRGVRRRDTDPSPATLTIDALATFRITRLLVLDDITEPIRKPVQNWLLDRHMRKLYELTSCGWCLGFWVSCGVVTARATAPRLWHPLALALAYSAVTGIIAEST